MRHPFAIVLLTLAAVATAQDLRPPIPLEAVLDRPRELTPRLPDVAWIPGDPTAVRQVVEPGADGNPAAVVRLEVATRERRPLFDAPTLRAALRAGGAEIEDGPTLPPFRMLAPRRVRVVADRAVWTWTIGEDAAVRGLRLMPGATAAALTADDTAGAFVVEHDLHVRTVDGDTRRLTHDGAPQDIVYGEAAHRAEFGIHDGLWWDPTGRRLAFSREDMTPIAEYPYVKYEGYTARSEHGRYPMAGTTHSKVTIGVYDRETGELVYLEHDPEADVYWTNVTFSPDGSEVWVALVDRAQSHLELVAFDAANGARLRTVLRESDPEWIEPEAGPKFLPDGSAFLWFSSRNGYRHLYRYGIDGTLRWMETEGPFDVKELLGFSADGRYAYVVASGRDPRQNHLFTVRLGMPRPPMMLATDPQPKMLNRTDYGEGWHDVELGENGAFVDSWSSVYRAGFLTVHTADRGRYLIGQVFDPRTAYRTGGQQMFTIEADDGTPLYGHVLLPPNPDSIRKHPVLLYVYGGPKAQLVQDRWQGGANLWLQMMASQGYVVVRLDGRGTPYRGIEFEQSVFRGLGEIEVIDQLRALEWVRENVAFADLERVGVHGWSFGGYMTLRLMLLAPDQFVCGVAGAPVTDWRGYETGYTERYMDTPQENPEGYEASSVLPLVGNLKGRLLLVQGSDDKTVMFSHSMAFLHRAVEEGVPVEFMTYPMAQHGLHGKDRKHFYEKMTRFFLEQLPPPPPPDHPLGLPDDEDAQARQAGDK